MLNKSTTYISLNDINLKGKIMGDLKKKWLESEEHKIYKFSEKEIDWLVDYEESTGYEPIINYKEAKDFKEIAQCNLRWYETHTQNVHKNLSLYPDNLEDDEIKEKSE